MKKLSKYILLLLLFTNLGCEEFLNETPVDTESSESFFQTEKDAVDAVTATYAAMNNSNGALYSADIIYLEVLSDNCWHSEGSTFGYFTFNADDAIITSFYTHLYKGVNRANLAIENIPGIEMDETLKNRLVGEAKFLRAYYYFLLTLLYGDVPLVTESTNDPSGFEVAKSPAEDIYEQIISDLLDAEEVLPLQSEYQESDYGRVSKGTAQGMLAKVYLFGGDETGNTSWYNLAEQKAEAVILSDEFGLVDTDNPFDDFKSLFTLENERNDEVLFSVNHQSPSASWGQPNATRLIIASTPRQTRGTCWGWGWSYVYKETGDPAYWEAGDARRDVTIWSTGDDMAPVAPDAIFDMTLQNRPLKRPDHYGLRKFFWTLPAGVDRNPSSPYNWPVLRYADLLLVHAEATLKNGSIDTEALNSYNAVRDRAGLTAVGAYTVDDVLKQRQYELFGELHRWFDLVRTKTAVDVFSMITSVPDKEGFTPPKHYKLPLPQQAINLNRLLEQNSNY
jgi:starch-binding outer membrane protein, SusD/RagB family